MTKLDRTRASSIARGALAAALLLGWASDGKAAEGLPEQSLDQGGTAHAPWAPAPDHSSAFLLAGKVGGLLPFSELGPFVAGGIELGYVFGRTNRSIAALLDVTYSAPPATDTESAGRVPDREYEWELIEKQLVLQPTFLYRFTTLELRKVTPYVGIGPRIYMLQSVVRGSAADGEQFGRSTEQSTKFGVGVPLGVELALGPGGVLAELLIQWGPLDDRITGDAHLASAALLLGYRALL